MPLKWRYSIFVLSVVVSWVRLEVPLVANKIAKLGTSTSRVVLPSACSDWCRCRLEDQRSRSMGRHRCRRRRRLRRCVQLLPLGAATRRIQLHRRFRCLVAVVAAGSTQHSTLDDVHPPGPVVGVDFLQAFITHFDDPLPARLIYRAVRALDIVDWIGVGSIRSPPPAGRMISGRCTAGWLW